jgi:transposase
MKPTFVVKLLPFPLNRLMARSDTLIRAFREPRSPAHRHFEICRAYFLEETSAAALAEQFGLHVGTVQSLVRDFAANPDPEQFFVSKRPGRKTSPKREAVRKEVATLRQAGRTLGEIHQHLTDRGQEISESYLATILREQGLGRGASRGRSRQPVPGELAANGAEVPAVADVRELSLESGREIRTAVAGLFLFLPLLLESGWSRAVAHAGYPGTKQIPALQALLGLLAPKLIGKRRVSHVTDLSMDEGAGLFAGLNVLPKTTYATDYSYRTERSMNERLIDSLVQQLSLPEPPLSFNLDFHAIPFRGDREALENHWVAKRHRGEPAVMAFVAQENNRRVMCYATANVLRAESDEMVVRFVDHWKQQTGHYPARVLFDSRATTYEQLAELERRQVGFITIRRRGPALVQRVRNLPASVWERCQILQAKGQRRAARFFSEQVSVNGCDTPLRQIVFEGLGHDSPTFLLTNDRPEVLTGRQVLETYAGRNHIEHSLGEKITFFHLDCLSSEVRLNVDFDLTLTLAAALLYQRLGERLKGFTHATPQTLFAKFVNTPGRIEIRGGEVVVYYEKRSHVPILKEAKLDQATAKIPWMGGKRVRLEFP